MGLREEEIRSVADLPSMRDRNCDLRLYRRGKVPEEFFRRLEFALSNHYGRGFEYVSFKLGERLPDDSIEDALSEMSSAGFRLTVSGSRTARMDFYAIGPEASAP